MVAYDESVNYKLRRAVEGRSIQSLKSGEGWVFEFTGPGRVYGQTRSPQSLIDWLRARSPEQHLVDGQRRSAPCSPLGRHLGLGRGRGAATASRTATLIASLSVGCANVVASSGPRSPLRVCSGIVSVASMSPACGGHDRRAEQLAARPVDHDLDEALGLADRARLADLADELARARGR